jgi:hypothetical protein
VCGTASTQAARPALMAPPPAHQLGAEEFIRNQALLNCLLWGRFLNLVAVCVLNPGVVTNSSQVLGQTQCVLCVVGTYLRAAAWTLRLHNYTHSRTSRCVLPTILSSLCRSRAALAWLQQATHEDHIGTIPARRGKSTKLVLLIKTDIARLLFSDNVDARTSRARGLRGKRSD